MSSINKKARAEAAVRDVLPSASVRVASAKWQVDRSYVQRHLDEVPTG